MRAVGWLVFGYFTGTAWLRWLTAIGAALILVGIVTLTYSSQNGGKEGLAFAGACAFFLGSSLMPLMFGRLARSHQIYVLPHGRVKLLFSAIVTTVLVALPLPVVSSLAIIAATPKGFLGSALGGSVTGPADMFHTRFFWNTFTLTLLVCTWLYVVLWFATSSRTATGLVRSLLVLIAVIFLPSRHILNPQLSVLAPLIDIVVCWTIFAAYFFLLPRFKGATARISASVTGFFSGLIAGSRYVPHREIDLLLGTARPWTFAALQVLPLLLATKFTRAPGSGSGPWLFYFVILSTVSGAVAGTAATRSRSIWLRTNWSRAELFTQVEWRFWRHNGYVLAVLLVLFVAIASYSGLPSTLILLGAPLLALGVTTSTYLGLMMTRGLRATETILAVGTMLLLMVTALFAADTMVDIRIAGGLEMLLTAFALALRSNARRRWNRLDWTLCRADAQVR